MTNSAEREILKNNIINILHQGIPRGEKADLILAIIPPEVKTLGEDVYEQNELEKLSESIIDFVYQWNQSCQMLTVDNRGFLQLAKKLHEAGYHRHEDIDCTKCTKQEPSKEWIESLKGEWFNIRQLDIINKIQELINRINQMEQK